MPHEAAPEVSQGKMYTSIYRASRGRKLQKKSELYKKERSCLQNVRKATNQRDAQIIALLWMSLLLFHGGDTMWLLVLCDGMWQYGDPKNYSVQ